MLYQQINSRVFVLSDGPESRSLSNVLCVGGKEEVGLCGKSLALVAIAAFEYLQLFSAWGL